MIKKGVDLSDENVLYYFVRLSIISFFANEQRLEKHNIEVSDFRKVMNFARDLYFEHCKKREEAQKL